MAQACRRRNLRDKAPDQCDSTLGIEDDPHPLLAAHFPGDDWDLVDLQNFFGNRDVPCANLHDACSVCNETSSSKTLGNKVSLLATELKQLLDELLNGDISEFRCGQASTVPEWKHIVIHAATSPG